MKKAIFIYGPSGVGKTTLSKQIIKKYDFKHCDTDSFMNIFSQDRSKERSEVASKLCYTYAKELINRNYNIICEAILEKNRKGLKKKLRENNYEIIEISLISTLEKCLANNMKRKDRRFSNSVIEEVYHKYASSRGLVINVTNLSTRKVLNIIEENIAL